MSVDLSTLSNPNACQVCVVGEAVWSIPTGVELKFLAVGGESKGDGDEITSWDVCENCLALVNEGDVNVLVDKVMEGLFVLGGVPGFSGLSRRERSALRMRAHAASRRAVVGMLGKTSGSPVPFVSKG
jgi:hypothetical protein